jgi:peptidoglycan/xylan/chitin deacetylase (PgdA/CDA1 family)
VRPWIPVFLSFKACGAALWLEGHPAAALVVFFAPDPWVWLQFTVPTQQAFGPAITWFETTRREVWLTIDDGPHPESTPRVLESLRRHGAKATFFVIGDEVGRHPELARRIAEEGHAVANHSLTHPAGTFWGALPARTAAEIDGCVGALLVAGVPFSRQFRPPVGIRNPFLDPQLSQRATSLVLWSARGFDGGAADPQKALRRIRPKIRPGAIVLAHEGGARAARRAEFVEALLQHLSGEGFQCVVPPARSLRRGSLRSSSQPSAWTSGNPRTSVRP